MSWRQAHNYENKLLSQVREDTPEVIDLARFLILAPRIEPLLLRNARLQFTPHIQPETESLLWFSPLIAARANSEIVLHQGIAAALAQNWMGDEEPENTLEDLWQFTSDHTRHWPEEDRLERDLRYHALIDDNQNIESGLGKILKRLHANIDDEERIGLSRLARRILPIISHDGQKTDESRVLALYVANALGDSNRWFEPGEPQTLPASLAQRLPKPMASSTLMVEVHEDSDNGQVIHFTKSEVGGAAIEFATPLPAQLYFEPVGKSGFWHSVDHNSLIKIDPPTSVLTLTTIEGRQWDLSAARYQQPAPQLSTQQKPLILSYFKADYGQIEVISKWLRDQDIPFDLHEESPQTGYLHQASNDRPIVRVWSRNAEKYWRGQSTQQTDYLPEGLFLRIDDVEPPRQESGRASVLDWPGTENFVSGQHEQNLLQALRAWMEHPGEPITAAASIEGASENTEERDTILVWLSWTAEDQEWMGLLRQQLKNNQIKCIDDSTIHQTLVAVKQAVDRAITQADAVFVLHNAESQPLLNGDKRIEEANTARKYNIPIVHISSDMKLRPNALYFDGEVVIPAEEIANISKQNLHDLLEDWRFKYIKAPPNKIVHISHGQEDEQINVLANLLIRDGLNIRTDPESQHKTKDFQMEMEKIIEEAACVVACWSYTSVISEFVTNESSMASEGSKLVSIILEPIDIDHLRLKDHIIIDFTRWNGKRNSYEYRQLVASISPMISDSIEELTEEFEKLLAEIENPITKPGRRLEIGDRLDEIGDTRPGVGALTIENPLIQKLKSELESAETLPERRLEIGNTFEDFSGGDPRPGTGLDDNGLPDIDWVKVPTGEFVNGEGKEQTTLHLDAFEIARYPVTNAQYQAFINDADYDDDQWWGGLKKPDVKESNWPQGNRPKINVDWFEATAFTRWLSHRLGLKITLPHETQWERAARGTTGLEYPWGNEYQSGYANVNETRDEKGPHTLEQTTAVGIYLHAGSPEGVLDLSGNVWEWCSNDYNKPTKIIEVPNTPVLRGGAWLYYPDDARAARRDRLNPDFRYDNIGFRLLRSPPS
jgi:formylglycine-generating enzyme required for sulfatase activity